jgi:probable rRNA maturation factor
MTKALKRDPAKWKPTSRKIARQTKKAGARSDSISVNQSRAVGLPSSRSIEIVIASPQWKTVPSVRAALRRAITAAWPVELKDAELTVLLTDDQTIHALNRQWRGHDKPTNVLSFPGHASAHKQAPVHLGDIVIAYDVTACEAFAEGKPLLHHLTHLAVHGFLHLVGYDHESHDEAETMENLERRILAQLGIPDPYATREAELS